MKILLFPLSILYGIIVGVRNTLFSLSILKEKRYQVPIISIGNITVGGTGKTPHTELLIQELRSRYHVAVLSRGYKRKSRGFQEVLVTSTAQECGDEPIQMKLKFPEITVVVDKNRRHAIDLLLKRKENRPDVILLDDAYQHRYVKPGINILLIDNNRVITKDHILPLGRLRESVSEKERADVVVVTKCPSNMKPIDFRLMSKELELKPYQRLFFTRFEYCKFKPAFMDSMPDFEAREPSKDSSVLLVTGIASPQPLINYLGEQVKEIIPLAFPDHHNFTAKDFKKIDAKFQSIDSENKVIITTEKDVTRFRDNENISSIVKSNTLYIPIEICFLGKKKHLFVDHIIRYIDENRANTNINGLID